MIELPQYEYLGPLGSPGQFGAVFHARNRLSKMEVAIKHIDAEMTPQALAQWEAESKAMAACSHANLVEILHAEITPDGPALVMEYLPGGSVGSAHGDEPIAVREAVGIAIDVCWGLHRLHLAGLTHRDIKPANLLIGELGIKLGDFGLAGTLTELADVLYLVHRPPEIRSGQVWTEQADVFALGATTWRLLWGDSASGRHDPDVLQRAASGSWPDRNRWPRHIHRRLRTVLRSALHPDPARRPGSAADLRAGLETAMPIVSWASSGANSWVGESGTTMWTLDVDKRPAGWHVTTHRDLGRGFRKQGPGCLGPLPDTEIDTVCSTLLEKISTTASIE